MKRIFAVLAMLVCVIGGITGILLLGNDEGDDVSTKKVQDAAGGDHGITEISSKESVNTEKSQSIRQRPQRMLFLSWSIKPWRR